MTRSSDSSATAFWSRYVDPNSQCCLSPTCSALSFPLNKYTVLLYHILYVCFQGKGYPDVNTRRFLRRLWDELQLPPLALVDADPHGISIHAVYRFGSQVRKSPDDEALFIPSSYISFLLCTSLNSRLPPPPPFIESRRYWTLVHAATEIHRTAAVRHWSFANSAGSQIATNPTRSIPHWLSGQASVHHWKPTPSRTGTYVCVVLL